MNEFAILDCTNEVVFEDEQIRVVGLIGNARIGVGGAGTTFVAVEDGEVYVDDLRVGEYRIGTGMYACSPRCEGVVGSRARALIVTVKRYLGIFTLGGPLEEEGRLPYIDGCTDTGLILPLKLGDPCLNALFFPPGIKQTRHYHPSHRVGLIYDGEGLCHTDQRTTPMRAGDLFVIPERNWHCFETNRSGMRIIAFHPDSSWGPTDETHQMLDATLTE